MLTAFGVTINPVESGLLDTLLTDIGLGTTPTIGNLLNDLGITALTPTVGTLLGDLGLSDSNLSLDTLLGDLGLTGNGNTVGDLLKI